MRIFIAPMQSKIREKLNIPMLTASMFGVSLLLLLGSWIAITANAQQSNSNNTNATTSSDSTAGETTVSMAKGSQAANNPEFYVPAEATIKPGETVT